MIEAFSNKMIHKFVVGLVTVNSLLKLQDHYNDIFEEFHLTNAGEVIPFKVRLSLVLVGLLVLMYNVIYIVLIFLIMAFVIVLFNSNKKGGVMVRGDGSGATSNGATVDSQGQPDSTGSPNKSKKADGEANNGVTGDNANGKDASGPDGEKAEENTGEKAAEPTVEKADEAAEPTGEKAGKDASGPDGETAETTGEVADTTGENEENASGPNGNPDDSNNTDKAGADGKEATDVNKEKPNSVESRPSGQNGGRDSKGRFMKRTMNGGAGFDDILKLGEKFAKTKQFQDIANNAMEGVKKLEDVNTMSDEKTPSPSTSTTDNTPPSVSKPSKNANTKANFNAKESAIEQIEKLMNFFLDPIYIWWMVFVVIYGVIHFTLFSMFMQMTGQTKRFKNYHYTRSMLTWYVMTFGIGILVGLYFL